MFDNLQISKGYKLRDNITGQEIEVCTFNTTLGRQSGIYQNMNINYPSLYEQYKDDILKMYREYESEVVALAVTMGLADIATAKPSVLKELGEVREKIAEMTLGVMTDVIQSLGNIQVNPVPIMDRGYRQDDPYHFM